MKKLTAILAGALVGIAGYVMADGVYGRVTGSSSAHGAATWTNTADYVALKVTEVTIKGAGITNGAIAYRITSDNVHTQALATVAGAGTIQTTISAPYLKDGDMVKFVIDAGNTAATSNFVYMIGYEVQRHD